MSSSLRRRGVSVIAISCWWLALTPVLSVAAAPSRASWSKAANIICASENAKIRALPRIDHPNTIAGEAKQLTEILPLASATTARISAIPRPATKNGAISTVLADSSGRSTLRGRSCCLLLNTGGYRRPSVRGSKPSTPRTMTPSRSSERRLVPLRLSPLGKQTRPGPSSTPWQHHRPRNPLRLRRRRKPPSVENARTKTTD
jgi:hypothetical protein